MLSSFASNTPPPPQLYQHLPYLCLIHMSQQYDLAPPPHPSPLSRQQVVCHSQSFCVSSLLTGEGGREAWSSINHSIPSGLSSLCVAGAACNCKLTGVGLDLNKTTAIASCRYSPFAHGMNLCCYVFNFRYKCLGRNNLGSTEDSAILHVTGNYLLLITLVSGTLQLCW